MKRNEFNSGEFNVTCDVCSKKIKSSESNLRWDGLVVCDLDMEERQSLDFVRARTDQITVPYTRPVQVESFTNVTYINDD